MESSPQIKVDGIAMLQKPVVPVCPFTLKFNSIVAELKVSSETVELLLAIIW